MRSRTYFFLSILINLGLIVALGAFFWANGVLAFPLSQPSGSPSTPDAHVLAVPSYMNYQGLLLDAQGDPVTGAHDLTFTIYKYYSIPPPAHWTAVFSQTQTLTLDQGLFNVSLGYLDPEIFSGWSWVGGGQLELGVQVDGGTEFSPRAQLNSAPYAFRSEYTNHMPYQEYNSGWTSTPAAGGYVFDHNLGGYPYNYVVVLDCQSAALGAYRCASTTGLHAYWYGLSDTQITVYVPTTGQPDSVRVRIWVSR